MAKFGEEIRILLADVAKFVFVTLKHVQLPPDASAHWTSLCKHLDVIKDNYPQLTWEFQEDEGHYASMDTLSAAVASGKCESESPLVAANDLRDAVIAGYLTRKMYKLRFQLKKKKLWCVVKKGVFYMYEKQDSSSQLMSFPLQGSEVKSTPSKGDCGFEVIVCGEKLTFTAEDESAANNWLMAISKEAKTEPDARVSILYQSPDELDIDASSGAGYQTTPEYDTNTSSLNVDRDARSETQGLSQNKQGNNRRAPALPSPAATKSTDSSEQRNMMRPPVPSPAYAINDVERRPPLSNRQSYEDESIYEDVVGKYHASPKSGNEPSSDVQRQASNIQVSNVTAKVAKQPVPPPVLPKTGGGGSVSSPPPVPQKPNTQEPGRHHAINQKTENGDSKSSADIVYDDVIYEVPAEERPPAVLPSVQMRNNSTTTGNAPAKRQSQPQLPVPAARDAKANEKVAASAQHIGKPTAEIFTALWDCQADADNELTFKAGDELYLIGKEYDQFGWWTCELHKREPSGNVTVRTGLVPKDFVRKV